MYEPGDFQMPDMRITYNGLKEPTRHLLTNAKNDDALQTFANTIEGLDLHGVVGALALTTCALDDLTSVLGRPAATGVALLSRAIPWRSDSLGVNTQALLSSWVARSYRQAMGWADQEIARGNLNALGRGLGERLVFAVETTALLSRPTPDAHAESFVDRFFSQGEQAPVDEQRGSSLLAGYPEWRWDEIPPLAPCRRPGCRQVVRWSRDEHTLGKLVPSRSPSADHARSPGSFAEYRPSCFPVQPLTTPAKGLRTLRPLPAEEAQ